MTQKFRFWDREKGCFVDDSLYLDSLGNVHRDVTVDFFGPEAIENPIRPIECIEVMQSTGLFDKNGKEIFESDIVKWEHIDTGQLVRGIVKYDTELGFWGMTDVRFNDLRSIGYLTNQRVTVLGNIYENPELVDELE
ncbi:TPA: hypothetical protein U0398_000828 [Streptococcus suis]|nr:hypothetical protein [Streptococcus suis]